MKIHKNEDRNKKKIHNIKDEIVFYYFYVHNSLVTQKQTQTYNFQIVIVFAF